MKICGENRARQRRRIRIIKHNSCTRLGEQERRQRASSESNRAWARGSLREERGLKQGDVDVLERPGVDGVQVGSATHGSKVSLRGEKSLLTSEDKVTEK